MIAVKARLIFFMLSLRSEKAVLVMIEGETTTNPEISLGK